MENNFEIFRPMCDKVMGDIDQLVQRTRRLNVVTHIVNAFDDDEDDEAMMS